MAKSYDYELAKEIVESKANEISKAYLGMQEDWFWTATSVYEDNAWNVDLRLEPEIAGLSGSSWATPVLQLLYKNGEEEFIECYQGSSDSERPDWFSLGILSGPSQQYVESVISQKKELK